MPDRETLRRSRPEALRAVAHPVMAVGFPFLFLQGLDGLMRLGIVPGYAAGPFGTLAVVLLAGVSRTLVSNILGRERISGFLPVARELLVTLIACGVILLLLTGKPFRGVFDPGDPAIVWPLVLCATQWLLTWLVQSGLRDRELFLRLISGKTGHGLAAALHDAGGEAGQAHEAFQRLRITAITFEVFTIVPWIIFEAVRALGGYPGGSFFLTARIIVSCASGVLFLVVLHGYVNEHADIGAGVLPADAPAGLFGAPVFAVAALFFAAFLLAGGKALVPLSALAGLFAWLNRVLTLPLPPAEAQAQQPSDSLASGMSAAGGMDLPSVEPSPLLEEILRIAGIVLAVAAAAGLAWFVVRPLFRRGLLASARRFHPLRATARAIGGLLRALRALPGGIARWLRSPGRSIASIPRAILETIREAGAGAGSAARAREKAARLFRGRAVKEFLRLARWGERNGVALSRAEAPLEYAARLARRAPTRESAIREVAVMFERLVYSAEPEPGGERLLARMINGIVR